MNKHMGAKRKLFLTVEFQLINVEGIMENRKSSLDTMINVFREEFIDAQINGKKYGEKQGIFILVLTMHKG